MLYFCHISAVLSKSLNFILLQLHRHLSKFIEGFGGADVDPSRSWVVEQKGVPEEYQQLWMGDHYPVTCQL